MDFIHQSLLERQREQSWSYMKQWKFFAEWKQIFESIGKRTGKKKGKEVQCKQHRARHLAKQPRI
jgi:hypothetical protein